MRGREATQGGTDRRRRRGEEGRYGGVKRLTERGGGGGVARGEGS